MTLTNTGSAALTITQISVNGQGYSASGLSTPTTISAGKTATFSLLFAPSTAGSLAGSVIISSNAPSSPNSASVTVPESPLRSRFLQAQAA